ncbi:MFS transporter [Prosthecobacter dejongeii]|uniref:OPA family glycerol-3-phosphate transporter-like MFS transporter n=1 Tax=Prosthecobacter dejongeii TaxID=48465 RepID=A0A7W7YNM4_9BACT|nr:MFS transporter [Prosthecobacter dejongeii]MBB5039503.1 OPA family glycerol-3-phosphate transporter-like MFS transporter [Prosthecobacter dejongeii]
MSLTPHSDPRFKHAQWRVMGAVMFCYLFYYTGRQTFGFAIPGIQKELGLSKETLGWISAAMLWSYALGQAINGNLGDRFGGRRMMALGAGASFLLNWLTSFGLGFKSMATAWGLNGLAQSMGWAPGSRLVANWFGANERGKAFGFYVLAAGLSSVLSFVTSLVILDVLKLDWRWIFRLPVILMLVGGMVVWIFARDRPSQIGFADFEDDAGTPGEQTPAVQETSWQRYTTALTNGRLLLAGLAIGFQNTVRYGLLIWVPVHFLGEDFKSDHAGKWISVALPLGMALGAVASGWISDRFCQSRRSGVISSFMLLAAISATAMYVLPRGHSLGLPLLFLCGFFAYGPQSAFWALAPDLLGRARAGTAVGIMNCFAYAMAGLGEPLVGWCVQHNPWSFTPGVENTALVFPIVAIFALCSAFLALFIRR